MSKLPKWLKQKDKRHNDHKTYLLVGVPTFEDLESFICDTVTTDHKKQISDGRDAESSYFKPCAVEFKTYSNDENDLTYGQSAAILLVFNRLFEKYFPWQYRIMTQENGDFELSWGETDFYKYYSKNRVDCALTQGVAELNIK